jgi:hypothetical protein
MSIAPPTCIIHSKPWNAHGLGFPTWEHTSHPGNAAPIGPGVSSAGHGFGGHWCSRVSIECSASRHRSPPVANPHAGSRDTALASSGPCRPVHSLLVDAEHHIRDEDCAAGKEAATSHIWMTLRVQGKVMRYVWTWNRPKKYRDPGWSVCNRWSVLMTVIRPKAPMCDRAALAFLFRP